jgi:hypothetical protein
MSTTTESKESARTEIISANILPYAPGTNFDLGLLLKLFCIVIDSCDLAHEDEILIYIIFRVARLMKADRVVVAMIVATAILVTPNVLTNPILAQTSTETQGTTNGGNTGGGSTGGGTTSTAANDESALYEEFQSCLESAAGGTTGFATEDEIRECFIDAGYTGGGDDNDNDEEQNTDDGEDTNN